MSSTQRLAFGLPFPAYVNETGIKQRLALGPAFVDETSGTVTTITLSQVTWQWLGSVLAVNARTQTTLAQAIWNWTANALNANARTQMVTALATWLWLAQPLSQLVPTRLTPPAVIWTWLGEVPPQFVPPPSERSLFPHGWP